MVNEPKYPEIAAKIRAGIESGEYPIGQRLPGLERMAETYKASIMTMRRAEEILQREGLLRITQGEGAFVVARPGVFSSDDERKGVVERLRKTQGDAEQRKRAEGRDDGIAWAKEYATADELEHFTTEYDGRGGDFQDHSLVEFFAAKDNGSVFSVRVDLEDPYWDGFTEGAGEVWDAVREEL